MFNSKCLNYLWMALFTTKRLFYGSILFLIVGVLLAYLRQQRIQKLADDIAVWGEANRILVDKTTKARPFKIEFDQKEWDDLLEKLELSRYVPKLDENLVPKYYFF